MIGQKGVPARFGGIERHVEELSTRLAARGHEIFIYCRPWYMERGTGDGGRGQMHRGMRLVTLPSLRTKNFDAITHTLISTVHAMIWIKPDIYHFHGVGPSLLSWMPRLFRPRARVVTTFHCIDRRLPKWGLLARLSLRIGEWAACRFAHQTITVSRMLEEYCQEVYERTTRYIPNGVNRPVGTKPSLLRQFNVLPGNYILVVSRLVGYKGIDLLIDAWMALGEARGKLKLAIVGDGALGDRYVADLKKRAGNDSSIVFTGFQTGATLDALYEHALFMVHPSYSEGMPMSVLEAMSHGKVVLASDIPGHIEVLGGHGVTFKTGDANDLAEKLSALLEAGDTLPELGEEAREHVIANHGWEDITSKIVELYIKLIPPLNVRGPERRGSKLPCSRHREGGFSDAERANCE